MSYLTIIGIVGRDARVGYFKAEVNATVTTFWIESTDPRGSATFPKRVATWHKVAVYGGSQKLAITLKKGDLVSVSGPVRVRTQKRLDTAFQNCCLQAASLRVLRRNISSLNSDNEQERPATEDFTPLPFQLRLALTS